MEAEKTMKITWLGHSCFQVESDGYAVVFDPYEDGYVPGLRPLRVKGNLVLCSHNHGDHNAVQTVDVLPAEGCPFTVKEIPTFHDDQGGTLRGENRIHILDNGSLRIAHLGDLGCDLDPEQEKALLDLDAVMIPVVWRGVNDDMRHADMLARVLKGTDCRVNLIRFHAIPDFEGRPATREAMERFRDRLNELGITATIRASRGEDIEAACGMLSGEQSAATQPTAGQTLQTHEPKPSSAIKLYWSGI